MPANSLHKRPCGNDFRKRKKELDERISKFPKITSFVLTTNENETDSAATKEVKSLSDSEEFSDNLDSGQSDNGVVVFESKTTLMPISLNLNDPTDRKGNLSLVSNEPTETKRSSNLIHTESEKIEFQSDISNFEYQKVSTDIRSFVLSIGPCKPKGPFPRNKDTKVGLLVQNTTLTNYFHQIVC